MNIHHKLRLLNDIYLLHEMFIRSVDLSCRPGCSFCCTQDVTLTTLEAYRVFRGMEKRSYLRVIEDNRPDSGEDRYHPVLTTNQLAYACTQDLEIPSDEHRPGSAKCPFLQDDLCSIYENRPFGCRCFVSRKDCGQGLVADVDPFILTANGVFLQFIEHIDRPGMFGNFLKVLFFLNSGSNLNAYEQNTLFTCGDDLLVNQDIRILMVPAEHRDRIRPLLSELLELKIPSS
jgi:Fe-S-cluster containining protein